MLENQDKTVFQNEPLRAAGFEGSTVHRGPEAIQEPPTCKAIDRPFGLYVHVPFCTVKCPYCDFYTYPATDRAGTDRYVQAVAKEIEQSKEYGWSRRPLHSIFLGGGTPSLLTPPQLETLLLAAEKTFDIQPTVEVTLEINPETVTPESVKAWFNLGINRASLGIQSLDDGQLERLKREHRSAASFQAFDLLRSAGFSNISLDLIFGLEGQTLKGWETTLHNALSWRPDHVSAYSLTIEEKTLFAVELRQKKLVLPSEETAVEMFLRTPEILQSAGLAQYEISNFAKAGFESRHNLNYWTGGNYWGVGASAHSLRRSTGIERWWNLRSVPKYIEAMENKGSPVEGREEIPVHSHWNERLITGLRLTCGVDLEDLARDLGVEPRAGLKKAIASFVETGYMKRSGSRIRLSARGTLVSDGIFADLVSA